MRPRPRRAGFGFTGAQRQSGGGFTAGRWLVVGVAVGSLLAILMRLREPQTAASGQATLSGSMSPPAQVAGAGSATQASPAALPVVMTGQQQTQQLQPVRPRPRGTAEAWMSAKLASQQCPIYSGPGWRKGRFAVKNTLVAEESLALLPDSSL